MPAISSVDSQPLLTIAIPTYNRAAYLDLCLTRIGEELDSLSADQRRLVKVYVSNNASSDATDEVIGRYRLKMVGEFEVVNNAVNIGGERNVLQCYMSASTPYVWVLGDDDVILAGGLQKVLDVLQMHNPDILYLGHYWFKKSYTEVSGQRARHVVAVYGDALNFARKTHVMLTFISGLVVRGNAGSEMDAVAGSNLPQLGWVLPLLRDGKRFAIIEDWIVAAQGGNSGGYELVNVFGSKLMKITSLILEHQPRVAWAIQNGTIIKFFPGFIFAFRKGNSQFADKGMRDGLKQAFAGNWRYYIFLAPLLNLPLLPAYLYSKLLGILRRLLGAYLI